MKEKEKEKESKEKRDRRMKKPSVTYEKLYRTRTPEERLRALLPGLLAKDQLPKALAPSAAAPLAVLPYTLRKESNDPTDGMLVWLREGFVLLEDEKVLGILPVGGIGALHFDDGMGAVTLLYEDEKGERHILCRSDRKQAEPFAALAKRFTRRRQREDTAGAPEPPLPGALGHACPKCGFASRAADGRCLICMDKRRSFKWFFSVIKTFMPKVVLVVLTFTLATLAGLLPPYLNGILVDHYIKAEEAPLFWGFVSVILAILGSSLLIRFLNIFSSLTVNNLSASVTVRLRELVFGKIQQLSVAGISKKTAGELIQRVNRDTNQANSFISGDLPNIIKQILAFFAIAALFFLYDWRLALLVLLPAALTSLALRKLWRKTHRLYHGQWMANAKASSTLQDIFSGIRVVKAFGAEERETEKYDAVIHEEYRLQVRNETFHAKFHPLLNFFMGIGQYFLLFYAGNQILDGSMTLGEMTRFSAYASMIFEPLNLMTSLPRRLAQVSTSIARIYDVIEDDDVLKDLDEKEITVGGTVEFRNVSFGYDSAREVLHNVSFKAVPGEMIGIVGRSGVGKSTLINLLMRMYDPEEGEILIDGVPLREISQTCLRSQIGAVLQETFLFSGTVYDNIAYAKPGAGREEVIAAARAAGAHKFIIRLTDGYDTYVGEHGYTLSGGERQRIAIARAILHDPRILVLDEATSALDTETEKEIQDALQRLAGSRTTFAIAHRLSTLRNATRILVLDKGRVVQIGSHEELMREKDGIYYGLVMAQRQMSKMPERKAS